MEIANLVIAVIVVLISMAGGLWTVYSAIVKKIDDIDEKNLLKIEALARETAQKAEKISLEMQERTSRIYARMDENKEGYYKDFILKEVYKETEKHQLELTDQKFLSMFKTFETHLNYMTAEIKALREKIETK